MENQMIDGQNIERKKEFDYARGIAICLVVLGHMTTYPRIARQFIYSFHMPLFFILSGITFSLSQENNTSIFLKKRINSIIIPAYFFELVMYVWQIVKNCFENTYSRISLIRRFFGIVLQIGYSDYTGSLWFLFTLFLALMIAHFILVKQKRNFQIVFAFICLVSSYLFCNYYNDVYLVWHFEVVPLAVFYICFGYWISKILKKKLSRVTLFNSTLVFLGLGFVMFFSFDINFAFDSHSFGNVFTDVATAILFSATIICFSIFLSQGNKTYKILEFIGKNSMSIYGIQAIMVGILNTIIWHLFDEKVLYSGRGYLISLVSFVISMIADCLFCHIYNKYIKKHLPLIKS